MRPMRPGIYLALLALPVAACLDSGTAGQAGTAGTLRVEVAAGDAPEGWTVLADRRAGPAGAEVPWDAREAWVPSGGPLVFEVACDAAVGGYDVEVAPVGAYAAAPATPGEPGAAAPAGPLDGRELDRARLAVTCEAGAVTDVRVDLVLEDDPTGLGDIAVNVEELDGVRDAVWDLRMESDEAPFPSPLWQQRIASTQYGDARGSAGYVGPCYSRLVAAENRMSMRLVGLYGATAPASAYGDAAPPNAIEHWPPPAVDRAFACYVHQDVFIEFDLVVARVERDDAGVHARFGALRCDAGWSCDDGASGAPTLALSCTTPLDETPRLYLNDLTLRCEGAEPLRIDPTVGAEVATQRVAGEPTARSWRIRPALDPTRLAAGPCVLEAAGTATLPSATPLVNLPAEAAVLPGQVYPQVTWTIPVSDALGPVCAPAALDLGGPVTITYTISDAPDEPAYDHLAAADGETRP